MTKIRKPFFHISQSTEIRVVSILRLFYRVQMKKYKDKLKIFFTFSKKIEDFLIPLEK